MQSGDLNAGSIPREAGQFRTTRWSIVRAAGQGDSPQSAEALEKLCRDYWYPLYAFLRRNNHAPEDAKDLTQGFFAHLIENHILKGADDKKGKFRSYLLKSLENFLNNERRKDRALKRGGGQPSFSLDAVDAEERYLIEPADHATPQTIFEQSWARTVMDRTLERLREVHATPEQRRRYERLKVVLEDKEDAPSYASAASDLNLHEGAVKTFIHRLRRRFGELLREEIAHTIGPEDDVDEELRYLLSRLTG